MKSGRSPAHRRLLSAAPVPPGPALRRPQAGAGRRDISDFYRAQDAKAASGTLHQEGGFIAAALPPGRKSRASAAPAGGDVRATGLRRLRRTASRHPATRTGVLRAQQFRRRHPRHLVGCADPDPRPGRRRPFATGPHELGIQYTPSLVFFDNVGREVFRTEAYLKGFHIQGALDYVASAPTTRTQFPALPSGIAWRNCTPRASRSR